MFPFILFSEQWLSGITCAYTYLANLKRHNSGSLFPVLGYAQNNIESYLSRPVLSPVYFNYLGVIT